MAQLSPVERTRDFLLYTILEQERKLFEKTLQTQNIITNPTALWYSYSSAFSATTLSMRVPLWFVCSIWTVWIPDLKVTDIGRITPSPDPQGASLALLAALDLPEHITPARHITCMCKWLRELLVSWSKDRASQLTAFSLKSEWSQVEAALTVFYRQKLLQAADDSYAYTQRLWSLCDATFTAGMPQEMTPDQIKLHVLGSPLKQAAAPTGK